MPFLLLTDCNVHNMQMLFIEVRGLLDSEQHGFEEMSNTKWCMFFFDDVSLSSDFNVDVIDVARMTFTNIVFFPPARL